MVLLFCCSCLGGLLGWSSSSGIEATMMRTFGRIIYVILCEVDFRASCVEVCIMKTFASSNVRTPRMTLRRYSEAK